MGNDENFEIDFFRPPIHEKKLIWVTTNDRSGKGAINQRYGSHSACNHTHKCVQKYEGLNSPYFFGSSNYLLSLFVKLRCPDPSESPKATLAHVNTRWCFTLCLGTISGSYKTSYKYFFSSLVTLRTEPRVSELICEIKGRKSVSVSGGDHACSLIFLPNCPGSLPGTVRYARSVTSSLWMIHGYKLPPKGMGRGGKALYFRAINLCAFNVVFSHMSKWW